MHEQVGDVLIADVLTTIGRCINRVRVPISAHLEP
jgi:hypothetical protein